MGDRDLVFLLGAGASTGIEQVDPHPPPLMRGLYDGLASRFPESWGESSDRSEHAQKYRRDFEETFGQLDLHSDPYGGPRVPALVAVEHQQELAEYFAEFRLRNDGNDLYSRLIRALDENNLVGRACVGTLNYECLFEQACRFVGVELDYLLAYAAAVLQARPREVRVDALVVAKLHGSCNFVCELDRHAIAMLANVNTAVESRIEARDPFQNFRSETHSPDQAVLPVMIQTSRNREVFVSVAQAFQIQEYWRKAAAQAAKLVVIGVAHREYDRHINEPIAASPGNMLYVGSEASFPPWKRCHPNCSWGGGTFEDAFDTLLDFVSG